MQYLISAYYIVALFEVETRFNSNDYNNSRNALIFLLKEHELNEIIKFKTRISRSNSY